MNQRLSTWLLFGAFLLWPLTACGQETNLSMARRTTLNTPSFQAEDPLRDHTRNWCLGFRSGAEYSGKRK